MKKAMTLSVIALLTVSPVLCADNLGIRVIGEKTGGIFENSHSGYSLLAEGSTGIQAWGDVFGAFFKDSDSSGYGYVGYGDRGVIGYGNDFGGYFRDLDQRGYAYVGHGKIGISGYGDTYGGYFEDTDHSGYGRVGSGNVGVVGYGNFAGAYFGDIDSSGYAHVGRDTFKIRGSGTVSFVQNHPEKSDRVIVYAAPEGDEVATYTRGTANLVNGEARISLGETFKWVTNPDIGLTAHLTPKGAWAALYVDSLTTQELIVKSASGSENNASFDYIVYGLRIGFEEVAIVQEKTEEAYIPSMENHRMLYIHQPELRQYTALERFGVMRERMGKKAIPYMKATEELTSAIKEFNPAVHELPMMDDQSDEPEILMPLESALPSSN